MSDTYPHVVVAVICQKDGSVLMVNETDNGINCWNQPAGHVEPGETLQAAAIREAMEETGYKIELTGLQGIYQGIHQSSGTHYVRVCFVAEALELTSNPLDTDIIRADWLKLTDLMSGKYPLRSEITRLTLEDIGNAPIFPTTFINSVFPGESQ